MILRTRNERVLYLALEKIATGANAELAHLIVAAGIQQAENEVMPVDNRDFIQYDFHIAEIKTGPQRDDL